MIEWEGAKDVLDAYAVATYLDALDVKVKLYVSESSYGCGLKTSTDYHHEYIGIGSGIGQAVHVTAVGAGAGDGAVVARNSGDIHTRHLKWKMTIVVSEAEYRWH